MAPNQCSYFITEFYFLDYYEKPLLIRSYMKNTFLNLLFYRLWCKYDMTRNGHTLEYMDFLKRLGVNAKPKSQIKKAGRSASVASLCECRSFP